MNSAAQYKYLPIGRQPSPEGFVNFIVNKTKRNYIRLEGCNTMEVSVAIQNFCVYYGIWFGTDSIVDSLNKPEHIPGDKISVGAGPYYHPYHNISFVAQFYLLALKAQMKAEKEAILSEVHHTQSVKKNPTHRNLVDPNPKPKLVVQRLANPNMDYDTVPENGSKRKPKVSENGSKHKPKVSEIHHEHKPKVSENGSKHKPKVGKPKTPAKKTKAANQKKEITIDEMLTSLTKQELNAVNSEFSDEPEEDVNGLEEEFEEPEDDYVEEEPEDNIEEEEEEQDYEEDQEDEDNFDDQEEVSESDDEIDEDTIEVDISTKTKGKKMPQIIVEKIGKARGRPPKKETEKAKPKKTNAKKAGPGRPPAKKASNGSAKKSGKR
jgi:hypothetical protein